MVRRWRSLFISIIFLGVFFEAEAQLPGAVRYNSGAVEFYNGSSWYPRTMAQRVLLALRRAAFASIPVLTEPNFVMAASGAR